MKKLRHFILLFSQEEYDFIKKNRYYNLFRKNSRYKIVEPDKLLIATDEANGNKSVVAEYETTGSCPIEKGTKLNLEPIYQAPRFHGVKLNERLLLAFKTELNLKKKVIEIKSKEYEIISHKLTS